MVQYHEKKKGKSKYVGVFPRQKSWVAAICQTYIGRYPTELEAAKAYNRKALQLYGNHATINKLSEEEKTV